MSAWTAGEFVVLALTSEDEPGDWDYEPEGSLSAIVGHDAALAGQHPAGNLPARSTRSCYAYAARDGLDPARRRRSSADAGQLSSA